MSYPADSTFELSMLRHTADDVCAFLAARRAEATARGAPAQLAVAVYNLSGKPFSEAKRAKFNNAVYDAPQLGFSPKRAPQLALLVSTLKTAHKWLARSPSNIILVNCIVRAHILYFGELILVSYILGFLSCWLLFEFEYEYCNRLCSMFHNCLLLILVSRYLFRMGKLRLQCSLLLSFSICACSTRWRLVSSCLPIGVRPSRSRRHRGGTQSDLI